jgi:hypothetical protein
MWPPIATRQAARATATFMDSECVPPTISKTIMNKLQTILSLFVSLVLAASGAASALAGDHCHTCGCCEHVEKVCRVVCEMKDVKTTVYDLECEDFCVACKSKDCGCHKVPVCGKVRTKKKLVKIECVKKVPTYKCVVEYLCPRCSSGCQKCASGDCASANENLVPAPAPQAALAPVQSPGWKAAR